MKAKLLLMSLFLIFFLSTNANPVSEENILKAARNFFSRNSQLRSSSNSDAVILLSEKDEKCVYYYALLDQKSGSWVILSADDLVDPVLAYSNSNNWNQDINPTFQVYLDAFKDHIKQVISENNGGLRYSDRGDSKQKWTDLLNDNQLRSSMQFQSTPVVDMLLKTGGKEITWSQSVLFSGDPDLYNIYCPKLGEDEDRSLTGCVATAMGMVLKYWGDKSSDKKIYGRSQNSYRHEKYGALTVNFQNESYNTDLMPAYLSAITYSGSTSNGYLSVVKTTDQQNREVAKLLYHCGVAVNMNYGISASGAVSEFASGSLATFFGFGKSYSISKSSYTDIVWQDILKAELDASRPVLYGGNNPETSAGHAFVIDGYDSDNFFHINWGWGPLGGNAYLNLGLAFEYSNNQSAIIKVHPDKTNYLQVLDFKMVGLDAQGSNEVGDFISVKSNTNRYEKGEAILYNPTNQEITCNLKTYLYAGSSNAYYTNEAVNNVKLLPNEVKTILFNIPVYHGNISYPYSAGSISKIQLVLGTDLGYSAGSIQSSQSIDYLTIASQTPPYVKINRQPVDQTVNASTPAVFRVYAQGKNPKYQWFKNGVRLEGKTKNPLLIENVAILDQGRYKCVVTDDNSTQETSAEATLTVVGGVEKIFQQFGLHHLTLELSPTTYLLNPIVEESVQAQTSYTSNNPTVATVDQSGKVVLLNQGNAVLTVSTEETTHYKATTAQINLSVEAPGSGNWDCVFLNNAASTSWNLPSNWNNGSVPNANSMVWIPKNIQVVVDQDLNIIVKKLKVSGILENKGNLTVEGETSLDVD